MYDFEGVRRAIEHYREKDIVVIVVSRRQDDSYKITKSHPVQFSSLLSVPMRAAPLRPCGEPQHRNTASKIKVPGILHFVIYNIYIYIYKSKKSKCNKPVIFDLIFHWAR